MSGKKGVISSRNKQYWINKGYNEKAAIKMARSRMPGTFEYYTIFKGYSKDDAYLMSKEWLQNKAVTLNNMIRKYGKEEGTYRFEIYRQKQAYTNTFEYKHKKYGWSIEQFNEYNKSRAITLENLISKYGIEYGTKKFDSYCERQRYAGCKLEYFIEKYGIVEGTEKYQLINFQKGHSYQSYLNKYEDPKIATDKFNEYQRTRNRPYSSIATELFDQLYNKLNTTYSRIFYINNMQEWYVKDSVMNCTFFIDFFVKDIKKGIEFNGDYWHANPSKYTPEIIINYPNNISKTAKEIWDVDNYKLTALKKHPDVEDILIVWENDYRTNPEKIIDICMNFLTT